MIYVGFHLREQVRDREPRVPPANRRGRLHLLACASIVIRGDASLIPSLRAGSINHNSVEASKRPLTLAPTEGTTIGRDDLNVVKLATRAFYEASPVRMDLVRNQCGSLKSTDRCEHRCFAARACAQVKPAIVFAFNRGGSRSLRRAENLRLGPRRALSGSIETTRITVFEKNRAITDIAWSDASSRTLIQLLQPDRLLR